MHTFTLLIPTLNEEYGLEHIMPLVNKDLFSQIIVSDGNSTDQTVEIALKSGFEVHLQKEAGIRCAYMEVWDKITGDFVITFSPDGNCKPEDIAKLVTELDSGKYDMVIASRYLPPATSQDDDIITGFGNWLFTFLINLLHGGSYTDAMGIYRGYRREVFYKLELDKVDTYSLPEKLFCTKIGIEPVLSVRAARAKLKVTEIPSDEPARAGGVRKLQIIRWGLAYLFQFFQNMTWKPNDRL